MNSPALGLRVASLVFGIVCVGHVVRAVAQIELRIGSLEIGVWLSLLAGLVTAGLSAWLWHLGRLAGGATPPTTT
jgi:hypothetical protein